MNSNEVYLALQVIPRLKNGNNYEAVDAVIKIIDEANIPYQVSAMETTMRGDIDVLLNIVKLAQEKCISLGAIEVISNIKIHRTTKEATDTFCTYERGITPNNAVFVRR